MDVDHCSEILQEIKLDTDALKLKIYSYLSEKAVDEDSLHQKNCSSNRTCSSNRSIDDLFGALGSVMRGTRRRDQTLADSSISLPDPARIPKNRHGGLDMAVVLNVAILFFLVYLFFAFCVKRTGMQAEEDFSLTCCHCQLTAEAREISKQGKPHVHCPCDKCNGRATWRMTA